MNPSNNDPAALAAVVREQQRVAVAIRKKAIDQFKLWWQEYGGDDEVVAGAAFVAGFMKGLDYGNE